MIDHKSRQVFALELRRLLRYRRLLLLGVLANFVLIARIPYAQLQSRASARVASVSTAKDNTRKSVANKVKTPVANTAQKQHHITPPAAARKKNPAPHPKQPVRVSATPARKSGKEVVIFAVSPPRRKHVPHRAATSHAHAGSNTPRADALPADAARVAKRPGIAAVTQQATHVLDGRFQRAATHIRRVLVSDSRALAAALRQPRFSTWLPMLERAEIIQTIEPAATRNGSKQAVARPHTASVANVHAARAAPAAATSLVLANPVANGGAVHYLFDGQVNTLEPGELRKLPAGRQRRIQFDRGGNYGVVDMTVRSGKYEFTVSAKGWALKPAAGPAR